MKISRTTLLYALELVAPALSSDKNQVEELSYFWFNGTHLSAFDSVLGIQFGFETDFKGGVIGNKFLGILNTISAEEIDIGEDTYGNILIAAGAVRVQLALKPISDWFWKPSIPAEPGYEITQEFLDAVDLTLLSVGSGKIMNPEQRGITIIQNGNVSDLYSTNAVTVSWMTVDTGKTPLFPQERLIIPTIFCEQLVKTIKPNAELLFDENAVYCIAKVQKSDLLLFATLVEDDSSVPFADTVNEYVNETSPKFDIPEELKLSLDRALVLLSDGEPAEFAVTNSKLSVYAHAQSDEVRDTMQLKNASRHPEVVVDADPGMLKRGLDKREFMYITKDAIVMTGPTGFYHIISTK